MSGLSLFSYLIISSHLAARLAATLYNMQDLDSSPDWLKVTITLICVFM